MTKFTPLNGRVLIERLKNADATPGGIIIPETAQEKTQLGVVVEVSEGKILKDGSVCPLSVKKGNKVLFGKYSGTEVQLGGSEYLVVKEDEILGIIS